jgi:hypothetical protein
MATAMLVVAAVLTVGCATETTALPPATAAPASSGRIRGVVKIGGAARAGIEVTLTASGPAAAADTTAASGPAGGGVGGPYRASRYTDAAGEVIFNDLPFGAYVMSVKSPSTGRSMGNPVSVSSTAASANIDFELGR